MAVIDSSAKFYVPAATLYETLLSSDMLTRMAHGCPCEIKPEIGSKYSLYAGHVTGEVKNVKLNECIEMSWRFANWDPEDISIVKISFVPEGEGTIIKVHQTNIPEKDNFDAPGQDRLAAEGWETKFWARMAQILGYPRDDRYQQ